MLFKYIHTFITVTIFLYSCDVVYNCHMYDYVHLFISIFIGIYFIFKYIFNTLIFFIYCCHIVILVLVFSRITINLIYYIIINITYIVYW